MAKSNLLNYLLLLSTITIFGQVDCKELQSKLTKTNKINSSQITTITKQEIEIQYLKETLNLVNSKISSKNKGVLFKINSVIGNSDTGKIIIEGLLVNNGVIRSIQVSNANAFDPQGNGMMSYKMSVGSQMRIGKLLKDIPTKFTIEFSEVALETPVITALIIKFHSNVGYKNDALSVIFKNLNVSWE